VWFCRNICTTLVSEPASQTVILGRLGGGGAQARNLHGSTIVQMDGGRRREVTDGAPVRSSVMNQEKLGGGAGRDR
jgi:hypothetical protein